MQKYLFQIYLFSLTAGTYAVSSMVIYKLNQDPIEIQRNRPYQIIAQTSLNNPELNKSPNDPEEENSGSTLQLEEGSLDESGEKVNIKVYGGNNISLGYGKSYFISRRDKNSPFATPGSDAVKTGFLPNSDMKIDLKGDIDKTLFFNINYDQKESLNNNDITVKYVSPEEEDFLRELSVGKIDINHGNSDLIFDNNSPLNVFGIDATMKKKRWNIQTSVGFSQNIYEKEKFIGLQKENTLTIAEYRYIRRQYYQLEPFLYYDQITSPPAFIDAIQYIPSNPSSLNTFVSEKNITPMPVNVDKNSVEIYMDDLDAKNDQRLNAKPKIINGNNLGNYHILSEGKDYSLEYQRGRIYFIQPLSVQSRLFVRYTRNGNTIITSDPASRVETNKIETFIKYGSTLNEDSKKDGVQNFNGFDDVEIVKDGKVNLDIYEIRGIYDLMAQEIRPESFHLEFYNYNMQALDSNQMNGAYTIDYKNGLIEFLKREPFKFFKDEGGNLLLTAFIANSIYQESDYSYISENSSIIMRIQYNATIYNFQLKGTNIIKNSEVVRVNKQKIEKSLYFIDYESGFFKFIDESNPLISANTVIEIEYYYLPYNSTNQNYTLESRVTYEASKNIIVGATTLYQSNFHEQSAPYIGEEPESKWLNEADIQVNYNEESLTRVINYLPGTNLDLLPVKLEGYAEYAQSYYNSNIMKYALIDDMESSGELVDIPTDADNWIISSLPSGTIFTQCDRAPLFYKHYYNPASSVKTLLNLSSSSYGSPPYSQLAGPYNVKNSSSPLSNNNSADGTSQSIVMEFDFASAGINPFISIATQDLFPTGADFSSIQFMEFDAMVMNDSNLGNGVNITFDMGNLNEDSDGDNILDTEDTGLDHINNDLNNNNIPDGSEEWDPGEKNSILDYERDNSRSEDIGYFFNPPGCSSNNTIVGAGPDILHYPETRGNGRLNSEDLDHNGILDTSEAIIRIEPGTNYLFYENNTSNQILPGSWKKYKIYFDVNKFNESQKNLFHSIKSLRIIITPPPGISNGRGKLLINYIRFGGIPWKKIKGKIYANTFENEISDPSLLRVTQIDNKHNDEYNLHSFLLEKRTEYEELHGAKTNNDLLFTFEGALKASYNIPVNYHYMISERHFTKAMDIKYYKYLNIWVNHRQFLINEGNMIIRIGNDEDNYFQYSYPITHSGWQKIAMPLSKPGTSFGRFNPGNTRYIAIGFQKKSSTILNLAGETWINDIFVSEPMILSDSAYKYDATIRITKPLITTDNGTPILSDIILHYHERHKNKNFQPIGGPQSNESEHENQLSLKTNILPIWTFDYGYSYTKTGGNLLTDQIYFSQNSKTEKTHHSTINRIEPENDKIPNFLLTYDFTRNRQQIYDFSSNTAMTSFVYQENIQKIKTPFLKFYKNIIFNESGSISYEIINENNLIINNTEYYLSTNHINYTPFQNKNEKIQQNRYSIDFTTKLWNFTFSPAFSLKKSLLLRKNFIDAENIYLPEADFYIPLIQTPEDYRYKERYYNLGLNMQMEKLYIFSPEIFTSIHYQDYNFRDYNILSHSEYFDRKRDPLTSASYTLNLPINPKDKISFLYFLDNILLSNKRELKFSEFSLPFHSQSALLEDTIGIKRTLPFIGDKVFNLYKYPLWYNFLSKNRKINNFSNARDMVMKNQYAIDSNYNISPSAISQYNNSLELFEELTTDIHYRINDSISLSTNGYLQQSVIRSSLYNLPVHHASRGYSILQQYNLMRLLDFWFWKKDTENSSTLGFNFYQDNHMLITDNTEDNIFSPEININFQWFSKKQILTGLFFSGRIGIKKSHYKEYISKNDPDALLLNNMAMPQNHKIKEDEYNYACSVGYSTEIPAMKIYFQKLVQYKLPYNPKYIVSLNANLNRFSYDITTLLNNQTLDRFDINQTIDINLHKNISGILSSALIYDIYRNPVTRVTAKQVFSFQMGMSANLLF